MSAYSQPVVSPSDDGYSDSANPGTNFGSSTALLCGYHEGGASKDPTDETYQFLLRVNLSAYLGHTILTGRLRFKDIGGSTFNNSRFQIYRCARTDWTEFGYTYTQSGNGAWIIGGGDLGSEGVYQTVGPFTGGTHNLDFDDIADLLQDAITNRGGILSVAVRWTGTQTNPNYAVLGSSENAGNEPLLEFTYDLPAKIVADTLEMTQLAQGSALSGKDPFAECLSAIPPAELAVGIFENQIRLVLNRIAAEHPGYRIHPDDNSFAAVLALDQPRLYLTALDRRVIKFLQHRADGCVISTREIDDCDLPG